MAQSYTRSKTFHCCGYKMEEILLLICKWGYPSCGTTDIDLNAALNIRDKEILELKAARQLFLIMFHDRLV
ncbi:hypothetical protein [Vibrio lentus]|uniref:hypothetical protein n=1 Tax=Vibrio lentus TaxID=136468 RepID=UPI003BB0AAEE